MIDPVDMVERKLSGIFERREIEIPYAWFENYVTNMVDMLSGNGIDKDAAELANNQLVINTFQKELDECVDSFISDPDDSIGDPWSLAGRMFAAEIEAKQKEQEELMAKAVVAATASNELHKAIPVRPRHRAQAIEILKQAGLFDEFFAGHVGRKLDELYGPKE